MSLIAFSTNATLWRHTSNSDFNGGPGDYVGFQYILTTEVNNSVSMWRPGDIVLVNGIHAYKYNASGHWTPATPSEVKQKVDDGDVKRTTDGNTDCSGRPLFVGIGLSSMIDGLSFAPSITTLDLSCRKPGYGSPLIIDMKGNGINLGKSGVGVKFDLFNDLTNYKFQWVSRNEDDVFLALDLNNNFTIDNGSELFGQGTKMLGHTGVKAKEGFMALSQYDLIAHGGNGDGFINNRDEIWKSILLWNDSNANGISEKNEITNISNSKIKSIYLGFRVFHHIDVNGNNIPFWSHVTHKSGRQTSIADVFFKRLD